MIVKHLFQNISKKLRLCAWQTEQERMDLVKADNLKSKVSQMKKIDLVIKINKARTFLGHSAPANLHRFPRR